MAYFEIKNGTSWFDASAKVQSLKVDREYLTSQKSGRNAKGDMTIDLVNKKWKLSVKFAPMTEAEAYSILSKLDNYVITVRFRCPWLQGTQTINCYISTPSIDYYTIQNSTKMVKSFSINFIEL